jgi:L-alanine-DL-glutamate epimerase-like enolase superfamily enzyme
MGNACDIQIAGVELFFLPVQTRVPLKFGPETLTYVTCARVSLKVQDRIGKRAVGWGETPLSVQWVWPCALSYEERHEALKAFCGLLVEAYGTFTQSGHPMEIGYAFLEKNLPALLQEFNSTRRGREMPWLAALVCCSAFDIALHDAYGMLHECPVYNTYNQEWMNSDLSAFITPAADSMVTFDGKYPSDFLLFPHPLSLPAWHLVGGMDKLEEDERDGADPDDGYPVVLREWIRRDGLTCLKVKLRGNDAAWDYARLMKVGRIAVDEGVLWLTADFNCTVIEPAYVNDILDRLLVDAPRLYGMILYVEQPFPYDLEKHRIDVRSVSARKPLFMDESAHDWRVVMRGRELGWTGVALKTCKTQTGALLSLCWAKAHGMTLMVQDLTNPMLAQIPHVLLAAHAGTIMGVETNGMQFYPAASNIEAAVHPGIYQRRRGCVDLSTITGNGFGHQVETIGRQLPEKAAASSKD